MICSLVMKWVAPLELGVVAFDSSSWWAVRPSTGLERGEEPSLAIMLAFCQGRLIFPCFLSS